MKKEPKTIKLVEPFVEKYSGGEAKYNYAQVLFYADGVSPMTGEKVPQRGILLTTTKDLEDPACEEFYVTVNLEQTADPKDMVLDTNNISAEEQQTIIDLLKKSGVIKGFVGNVGQGFVTYSIFRLADKIVD